MRIAAERAHAGALIALERAGELVTDCGFARPLEIDKEDRAAKHRSKKVGAFAGEVGHRSRAARGGEREKKLAFGLEGGEPCGERMRGAGADDDDVGWIKWALRAVSVSDGDLRPGLKRDARTGGERFVDFDGDDFSMRAGELGKNGGVIAGAAAEMKNVIAGMNVEQAKVEGPQAGLAVVQELRGF